MRNRMVARIFVHPAIVMANFFGPSGRAIKRLHKLEV